MQNCPEILDLPAFLPNSHPSAVGRRNTNVQAGTLLWQMLAGASTLAGNRDVLAAARMAAVFAGFRHGARDFVRIDPSIGRGLCEIPRLAIGQRGMGAALLALGEALVDAIAVGLVGNDENPAVGPRGRPDEKRHAGEKR